MLDWHLDNGTRPDSAPDQQGKRWYSKTFASALKDIGEKAVRNWRAGRNAPTDLASIERELFGDNPAYAAWRRDLRDAYDGRHAPIPDPEPQPTAINTIPPPPAHFLGRGDDIKTILAALPDAPAGAAILIQGGPGLGKSALSQALGHHGAITARFAERRFVALETATTAVALCDAVARAVGADPAGGFAAVLALLRQRPSLLILDNLETPWTPLPERRATQEALAQLAAVPGLALVASFRGHYAVGGPAWTLEHPVGRLRPPEDADLFRRVADWRRPEDPDLARLVVALGGIPLAIRLVAARAHGRTVLAPLWAQWQRVGADLAVDPAFSGDPDRLSSLPHSIELSLRSESLTAEARRLFRLLGQLPAGLCGPDRDALLGLDGFEAEESLVQAGLAIERDGRADLLPPIREYAARHHRPEPADAEWPAYFLGLTQTVGEAITTRAGEGAVGRLLPEFANIEAAIRAVLARGRRADAMMALDGFSQLTVIAARPTLTWSDLAAACRADDDVLGEANCIAGLGAIAQARSDHDLAQANFEQALPLYQKVGSVQGEANCIASLGEIAQARSEYDAARATFKQALALYRQVGDLLGEANCTFSLGEIAQVRSDHDAARTDFKQAMPLFRQVDSVQGEANCIASLGAIALARSDHDAARANFEQALPLFRQVGSVQGEANCIARLGEVALARSDPDAARDDYAQALLLFRQVSDVLGEANCIAGLGAIAQARSDHDLAQANFEQALPLYQKVGSVQGEANCIASLGEIAQARSDHDAARVNFEQALPLYRQVGDVQGEAACCHLLADLPPPDPKNPPA